MQRYHFTLSDDHLLEDPDGEMLDDDAAACEMAVAVLAETVGSKLRHLVDNGVYRIEATDAQGRMVFRLTLTGESGMRADRIL